MKSKEEILNEIIVANAKDTLPIAYGTALVAMEEYASQYTTAQTSVLVGQFIDLVVEMRDLQRKYFRGDKSVLEISKKVERKVDNILRHIKTQQEKLL